MMCSKIYFEKKTLLSLFQDELRLDGELPRGYEFNPLMYDMKKMFEKKEVPRLAWGHLWKFFDTLLSSSST